MTATLTDRIDPARTALLVMDYQAALVASLEGADALLARAAEAVATVRERGGHIGFVRVGLDDADIAAMPPTSRMAARIADMGPMIHADSPATAHHERVAPRPGDIAVRKTRVGAFSTTDLDEQLRARGVDTLILAGISTSGVVLSTVRDAHDRDYRLYVLADACADRQTDVHDTLIDKVFPRQADVITVADLRTLLTA
jgi:nicotinamidase-related amidase